MRSPTAAAERPAAERLVSIEVGKRFVLNGIDVRAIAAASAPEGLVALSGRQGLWLASPEDASGERHLTRAITKDAAGKWIDLGSTSWCPDLRKTGWLGAVRQRSVLLWDAGVGRACGAVEMPGNVRAVTDMHWGEYLATGAMDGSVRLHDHRDLRHTVAAFSSKSIGHTQVRINAKVPVLVASAQAGYIQIWDLRQPKKPLSSIIAHISNKVGKFDWGRQTSADQIVTCSPMESEVKCWKVRAAQADVLPAPSSLLKFSSMVASTLMAPSGALVLTAHSDARIRLCPLPEPGLLEEVPKGMQGDAAQKTTQCLLSFSTGSPVERRVDVAQPLPGMRSGGPAGARGEDGAGDFRVLAVTSPVGASAPMLREWLITSQAATAMEQTSKPGGGTAMMVGGWGSYLEDEEEGDQEAAALRADLWDGEQLPVGITCTAVSAGEPCALPLSPTSSKCVLNFKYSLARAAAAERIRALVRCTVSPW
jgi:hypothetical protein